MLSVVQNVSLLRAGISVALALIGGSLSFPRRKDIRDD